MKMLYVLIEVSDERMETLMTDLHEDFKGREDYVESRILLNTGDESVMEGLPLVIIGEECERKVDFMEILTETVFRD